MQQPLPPLWFAPIEPSRAADAARLKGNIVTLIPNAGVKALTEAYRAAWQAQGNNAADIPLLGVFRHVIVADSDAKARDLIRSAYRQWRHHMAFLWEWGGIPFPIGMIYPDEFETLEGMNMGVAGSPETVRRYVAETIEQTGINYFVADYDLRIVALRSGVAFGRLVRQRGNARIPLSASVAQALAAEASPAVMIAASPMRLRASAGLATVRPASRA